MTDDLFERQKREKISSFIDKNMEIGSTRKELTISINDDYAREYDKKRILMEGKLKGGVRKRRPNDLRVGDSCRYTTDAARSIGGYYQPDGNDTRKQQDPNHHIGEVSRLALRRGYVTHIGMLGSDKLAYVDWGDGDEPMPILMSNLEYARHPKEFQK